MKRKRLLQELRGIALANGNADLAMATMYAEDDDGTHLACTSVIWIEVYRCLARSLDRNMEALADQDTPLRAHVRMTADYLEDLTKLLEGVAREMQTAAKKHKGKQR